MAYAALLSLKQTLDQKLRGKPFSRVCTEQETRSLYEDVDILQAFFEAGHSQKVIRKINCLESRITDAAYEAEDIIGSPPPTQMLMERKRKYVQEAMRKIKEIAEEVNKMKEEGERIDAPASAPATSSKPTLPPTIGGANTTVGLNKDLLEIKDRLFRGSPNLEVISIVGMGGIGKTTLARNVYDDRLTYSHFDVLAWVTVSQEYTVEQIHRVLLKSIIMEEKKEHSSRIHETLAEQVYKGLVGRRFLIVIDDLWSKDAWDDIRRSFPDNGTGSRIVLTTRLSSVAVYADACSHPHEMNLLSDVQSWNLLREKVFGQEERCPPELKEIGKTIAGYCRGLPLAIVVVAGLLSKLSRSKDSWERIAGDVNDSTITTNDENIAKILSLSYDNLPHYLRACFLYMSGFPEDCNIRVSKLFKLWIAEGFLKPDEDKSLEDVAEEYLKDLSERSLVFVSKALDKIKTCHIHDLIRDLCMRKAKEEKFLFVLARGFNSSVEVIKNHRRLSFPRTIPNEYGGIPCPQIRSVIVHSSYRYLLSVVLGFQALRVLDAEEVYLNRFPEEIVKLHHLRYLAIRLAHSRNGHRLPESIYNLQNLETLIVRQSLVNDNFNVPSQVWNMRQLKCIVISSRRNTLSRNPCRDHSLENLQTLKNVTDFRFTRRAINQIPNVKKLGIILHEKEWSSEYHLNDLIHLKKLEKLSIFSRYSKGAKKFITFPQTLKKLTISGSWIPWTDISIIGSLPILEVLKLQNGAFTGPKWESIDGEFLRLKSLQIERLSYFTVWKAESSHFPNLEELIIRSCRSLKGIPSGIGDIPTLQLISVTNSFFAVNSAKQIEEEQRSLGNDVLQIRIIH